MAFIFPSSPSVGTQYPANTGRMYLYDNSASWSTKGDTQTSNPFTNSFTYRTIYTRGYTSAGYASGTPWRNVNRTVHSTDITTNLGDLLDYGSSYIDGSFSDYNHYVYGNGSQAVGGSSTYTSSINMSTEANRTHTTNWDTKASRSDCISLMNSNLTMCYITGGGSAATDKHNFVTDVMYAASSAPANPVSAGGTAGGVSGFYGELYGWINVYQSIAYIAWSNETWIASSAFAIYTDGQPKGLSSKHGYGYCSAGSYAGTTTLTKFNDITGATISGLTRPESAGEENWQTGQNWGYSLGSFNGAAQTNNSSKVYYLTDTCVGMGADTMPKGHAGMSSGCCGSASSLIVGGA